jgi:hypothetical protein
LSAAGAADTLINPAGAMARSAQTECFGSGLGGAACWAKDGSWAVAWRAKSSSPEHPSKPQLSGEWRGDGLAIRALDHGMRLERGKLLLQLTGEQAR